MKLTASQWQAVYNHLPDRAEAHDIMDAIDDACEGKSLAAEVEITLSVPEEEMAHNALLDAEEGE